MTDERQMSREARKSIRRIVRQPGAILNDGALLSKCTVIDVSASGAMIKIQTPNAGRPLVSIVIFLSQPLRSSPSSSSPSAWRRQASELSPNGVLKHLLVQRQVGDDPLQLAGSSTTADDSFTGGWSIVPVGDAFRLVSAAARHA